MIQIIDPFENEHKYLSAGHFAQRGSYGRRAEAVALSEGRVSHRQTDPQRFSSLFSFYQVLFIQKVILSTTAKIPFSLTALQVLVNPCSTLFLYSSQETG